MILKRRLELRWPHRADRWAILALAALTAVLFKEILFRGRVLYERDILMMVYPQAESFTRCIAAGSWPLWNPHVGFGQPMLANPGAQVLYPWTWINLVCLPETSYTIYVTGHLLLSGAGLFALCRRLGLTSPASLTAAALWMLSGPLLSLVSLWQHFAGAAWIPWVLLAADAALVSPGPRRCLLWGAALAGQILAGSVEMCVMSGFLQAALALRHLRGQTWREAARRIVLPGASSLAFALALTAGLWLPAGELLRASSRAELAEGLRTFWSLHPLNLVQVLLPVLPQDLPLRPEVKALLFEGREPFLNSVYLGLASVPLVVSAFLGPRWRLAGLLAAGGAVAALLALGKFGVAYPLATVLLPPLRLFRYPAKAMIVTGLAWSLLAGLGYDAWRESRNGSARRWGLTALLPTVVAIVSAFGIAWFAGTRADAFLSPDPSGRSLPEILAPAGRRLVAVGGLTAAALALGVARTFGLRFAPRLAGALAVLAASDLLLVHGGLNPTAPRELIARRPAVLGGLGAEGPTRIFAFDYFVRVLGKSYSRRAPPEPRAASPDQPPALAAALAKCDSLSPPSAQRWGLYGSYDYDWLSLYPKPLRNLTLFLRAVEETPAFARLLRVGSVSYVVTLHTEGLDALAPVATVESAFAGPVHVFSVPGHQPRTYAVGGARILEGLPALRALVDPAFDPAREIILSKGASLAPSPRFSGESRIVDYAPDRVRMEARLNEPGYVVVPDAYDAGWRATVEDGDAPVLRANVAFRAVAVPAGAHTIEMRYRPLSALVGLLVSALTLAAGLALLVPLRSPRPGRDR